MALETEGIVLEEIVLRKGITQVFHSLDKGFYLVAEENHRLVGSLLITYEWSDWRNATFWWIQSVFVDPKWRRKGVYRALHQHLRLHSALPIPRGLQCRRADADGRQRREAGVRAVPVRDGDRRRAPAAARYLQQQLPAVRPKPEHGQPVGIRRRDSGGPPDDLSRPGERLPSHLASDPFVNGEA